MGVSVEKCTDPELLGCLAQSIKSEHPDVSAKGATIGVLWAKPASAKEDDGGPVLKFQGHYAAAIVRVSKSRERAFGMADAVITVDFNTWGGLDEDQQAALIDHELEHLEFVLDSKTGILKTDEHGRPKMRCKLHDWQFGGFHAVAQRHENAALEVMAVQRLTSSNLWRQLPLQFPVDQTDEVSLQEAASRISAARI